MEASPSQPRPDRLPVTLRAGQQSFGVCPVCFSLVDIEHVYEHHKTAHRGVRDG